MKKQYKALVISIIALVFLLISYVVVMELLPDSESASDKISIISGNHSNISIITVEYPQSLMEGYKYVIFKDDTAEDPYVFYDNGIDDVFNYSQGSLEQAFTRLMALKANSLVVEETDNLAQYGLDESSAVKVTAKPYETSSSDTVTLLIGNKNEVINGYYAKLPDKPEIYLISTTDARTFVSGSLRYRAVEIIPSFGEYYDEIKTVTFTNVNGEKMVMKRFDSYLSDVEGVLIYTTFHMVSPYSAYVSDAALGENLLDLITASSVVQAVSNHPTEEELSVFGFNTSIEVEIELLDITVKYKIGMPGGNPSSGLYYLMVNDIDTVFEVYGEASYATYEPIDFLSSLVWLHKIKDITSVDINLPSGHHQLRIDDTVDSTTNTGVFIGTFNGQTITENNGRYLYQSIINISFDNLVSGELLETEPSYSFTIKYRTGFTETVSFYKVSSRQYAVLYNDDPIESAGFCVNVKDLRLIAENIDTILAGGTLTQ